MRYDANISILFPHVPLLDRPSAAADAGFDAIESWWPYDVPVPAERDVDDFADAIAAAGSKLVMLNLDLGDAIAGQHGLLGIAAERQRFRDNLDVALELMRRVGGSVVNSHVGNVTADLSRDRLLETAEDNLRYAAGRASEVGVVMVVEALNSSDFPRYGLTRTIEATELAHRSSTEDGQVKILFDLYHVQRTEGDLTARAQAHIDHIGHVQVADVPGRLAPGTGEIAVARVLDEFDRLGYDGYAGLEYHPSLDPNEAFAWLDPALRRSQREGWAGAYNG